MKRKRDHEIEKGIPIYKSSNYWDSLTEKMEVGDSILFLSRAQSRVLSNSLKSQGFKYTGRSTPDGYRIWKGEKDQEDG